MMNKNEQVYKHLTSTEPKASQKSKSWETMDIFTNKEKARNFLASSYEHAVLYDIPEYLLKKRPMCSFRFCSLYIHGNVQNEVGILQNETEGWRKCPPNFFDDDWSPDQSDQEWEKNPWIRGGSQLCWRPRIMEEIAQEDHQKLLKERLKPIYQEGIDVKGSQTQVSGQQVMNRMKFMDEEG